MTGILARKIGMTQRFDEEGRIQRVTVLEAGPCPVTAIRTAERDGYSAVQLAFVQTREKLLSKPARGHLKRAGVGPHRTLVEFRSNTDSDLKVGDSVSVEQFEPGQHVRVSGVSKGKGFQGTVKRHGFSRGPVTHGSHNVRQPGSIGAAAFPARVFKGIRGPGQMGNKRITQRGLTVVEVIAENNLLLVRGSVPGARGCTVEVRFDG